MWLLTGPTYLRSAHTQDISQPICHTLVNDSGDLFESFHRLRSYGDFKVRAGKINESINRINLMLHFIGIHIITVQSASTVFNAQPYSLQTILYWSSELSSGMYCRVK
jgi:hypothetical protein